MTFDALAYTASHADLAAAFGTDAAAAARHYIEHGRAEGRTVTFDAAQYLSANSDLSAAFGADTAAATRHYIQYGRAEGRPLVASLTLTGTPGNDTLVGGSAADYLQGGAGNDTLYVGNGDIIAWQTGDGTDTLDARNGFGGDVVTQQVSGAVGSFQWNAYAAPGSDTITYYDNGQAVAQMCGDVGDIFRIQLINGVFSNGSSVISFQRAATEFVMA